MNATKVRTVRFAPYRKGCGPRFTLDLFDIECTDSAGRHGVGYELRKGKTIVFSEKTPTSAVFVHCAVDSDAAVRSVMGFLTLRPGDTDADYFRDYTPDQFAFASCNAEALACEVYARFGED